MCGCDENKDRNVNTRNPNDTISVYVEGYDERVIVETRGYNGNRFSFTLDEGIQVAKSILQGVSDYKAKEFQDKCSYEAE